MPPATHNSPPIPRLAAEAFSFQRLAQHLKPPHMVLTAISCLGLRIAYGPHEPFGFESRRSFLATFLLPRAMGLHAPRYADAALEAA